jgi:hypothetical protein
VHSHKLIGALDPALVWSEFLGVIKGSEKTLKRDEGYLDKSTYLGLSHRSNSTFASSRETVWKLFDAYLKRKRTLGDRDAADRTRNILKYWRQNELSGSKIDFLSVLRQLTPLKSELTNDRYVDEAQDNLLVDALCKCRRLVRCGYLTDTFQCSA